MITVPVLLGLVYLIQQTRQGKAMRATAQDMDASAMMGINVNRTISFTFLIAGSLAGAAGLVYSLYFTSVRYDQGFQLGLIAFTSAVLGGIGNLPGAVLGATLIGLLQGWNEGLPWHAPGSDWTESIVFSILILILVFRPAGPARGTDAGGRVDEHGEYEHGRVRRRRRPPQPAARPLEGALGDRAAACHRGDRGGRRACFSSSSITRSASPSG